MHETGNFICDARCIVKLTCELGFMNESVTNICSVPVATMLRYFAQPLPVKKNPRLLLSYLHIFHCSVNWIQMMRIPNAYPEKGKGQSSRVCHVTRQRRHLRSRDMDLCSISYYKLIKTRPSWNSWIMTYKIRQYNPIIVKKLPLLLFTD